MAEENQARHVSARRRMVRTTASHQNESWLQSLEFAGAQVAK